MALRLPISMVAFDMFGTLVHNDTQQWVSAFVEIVREQHLPIVASELHKAWSSREVQFRKTRTNTQDPETSPSFRTYYEAWRDTFEETFAALHLPGDASSAARYCLRKLSVRHAYPEAQEVLELLARQWPLAVLSNADDDFLYPVLDHNGWSSPPARWSFHPVVSSESARAYKPDPRIFATFCAEASVAPEQVLYVGDSRYDDVHGAKLAGMRAVWLRRGGETPGRTPPPEGQDLLAPDFEISSLEELEWVLG